MSTQRSKTQAPYRKSEYREHSQDGVCFDEKQRIVKKRYNVTSQTAYHIQELALQEQTTEGRILDKIMRCYLANRAEQYHRRHDS